MAAIITWLVSFEKIWLRVVCAMTGNPPLRGFQAHKQSCRVLDIPDLRLMFELGPDPEPDPDDSEETYTDSCSHFEHERVSKLPGIKLPKSEDQWKGANKHFKTLLPYNSEIANIEYTLVHTQKSIYQYFSEKYGCINTNIFNGYSAIYGYLSKRQLKLKLWELKTVQYPQEDEIKFVSFLLHSKYNPNKKKRINSNITWQSWTPDQKQFLEVLPLHFWIKRKCQTQFQRINLLYLFQKPSKGKACQQILPPPHLDEKAEPTIERIWFKSTILSRNSDNNSENEIQWFPLPIWSNKYHRPKTLPNR